MSSTLEVDDLWSSWHYDEPVNNIWRTLTKGEGLYRLHFRRQRHDKTSERGQAHPQVGMLRSAIQDGQLPVVRFLLGLGGRATRP